MKKTWEKCGAVALIEDSFCMECGGAKFKSINENTKVTNELKNIEQNHNPLQTENEDDKLSNKTYFMIFGVILLVFISVWFYKSKSISNQNEKDKIAQDSISKILLKDSISKNNTNWL